MPEITREPMPFPTSMKAERTGAKPPLPTSTPPAARLPVGQSATGSGTAMPPAEAAPGSQEAQASQQRARQLADRTQRERQAQRELEQERMTLTAERAAFTREQQELAELRAWKEKARTNTYEALLDAGLTAEEATARILEQPQQGSQQLTLLQRELASVREELKTLKSGQEESDTQLLAAGTRQMASDVDLAAKADPQLEFMRFYGKPATDIAVEYMNQVYEAEGVSITAQEAAEATEAMLADEYSKGLALGKVKAKFAGPAEGQTQQPAARVPQQQKPPVRTLSSRMVPAATKNMTYAERRARAIAVAEGRDPNTQ